MKESGNRIIPTQRWQDRLEKKSSRDKAQSPEKLPRGGESEGDRMNVIYHG